MQHVLSSLRGAKLHVWRSFLDLMFVFGADLANFNTSDLSPTCFAFVRLDWRDHRLDSGT